jgi:hypothetical protein
MVNMKSGTSFPVHPAANDEKYALHPAANDEKYALHPTVKQEQEHVLEQQDISTTIQVTLGKFAKLIDMSNKYYNIPAANDGRLTHAA